VKMLSSTCTTSRAHAAIALFHTSMVAEIKSSMTSLGVIPQLVRLLSIGSPEAQRHAAGTLWHLAASADCRTAIVDSGGIHALLALVRNKDGEEKKPDAALGAPTPRAQRQSVTKGGEPTLMTTKEAAAAVLSELARSQNSFRIAIAKAGGISSLVELLHNATAPGVQKHATIAVWGLTCEPKYRKYIGAIPGTVERLVELLRNSESETQGFAAATLVCLAAEESGKQEIAAVGGAGPLMTIALGPESWLRSQCMQVLKILGYEDPAKKLEKKADHSSHLARFQQTLAAHPDLWMCAEEQQKSHPVINEEHMSDLACKIKVTMRVLVDPGDRKAEVMFVGKIPDIAPGWWVGVQYDDPVGKNDGSVKGQRLFECAPDFGGFLRPDHIHPDPDPPVSRTPARKATEEKDALAGSEADDGKTDGRRKAGAKRGAGPVKSADTARQAKAKAPTETEGKAASEELPDAPAVASSDAVELERAPAAAPTGASESDRTEAASRRPRRPLVAKKEVSPPKAASKLEEQAAPPKEGARDEPSTTAPAAPSSARVDRTRRSAGGAGVVRESTPRSVAAAAGAAEKPRASAPAVAVVSLPVDANKSAQYKRGKMSARGTKQPSPRREPETAQEELAGKASTVTSEQAAPVSARAPPPASAGPRAAPLASARAAPLASARAPPSARGTLPSARGSGALTARSGTGTGARPKR